HESLRAVRFASSSRFGRAGALLASAGSPDLDSGWKYFRHSLGTRQRRRVTSIADPHPNACDDGISRIVHHVGLGRPDREPSFPSLDDWTSCPERHQRTYARRTPPAARTGNSRTQAVRSTLRSSQPRAELLRALGLGQCATRTSIVCARSDPSAPVGSARDIAGGLPRDLRLLCSYALGEAARSGP